MDDEIRNKLPGCGPITVTIRAVYLRKIRNERKKKKVSKIHLHHEFLYFAEKGLLLILLLLLFPSPVLKLILEWISSASVLAVSLHSYSKVKQYKEAEAMLGLKPISGFGQKPSVSYLKKLLLCTQCEQKFLASVSNSSGTVSHRPQDNPIGTHASWYITKFNRRES